MKGRGARMSRKQFEQALALSRSGDVAGALAAMGTGKPSRRTGTSGSFAGRQAHVRGATFQQEIRESFRADADQGRCVWAEGNPRVRGAPGAMFPVEPATVDFSVLAAGTPIALDCKTHDGGTYSITSHTGDTKNHDRDRRQIEWLLDFRKHGGISFLLVGSLKRECAWLVFQLQTLLDGGVVKLYESVRAQRGIPPRIIHHVPVVERLPLALGARWRILDAAITHGRKTMNVPSVAIA